MGWIFAFLVACIIVALVARKKGRSGVKYFLFSAVPAVPLMIAVSAALGGNMDAKPLALGITAFLCPAVGLVMAIMADNDQQVAVKEGQSNEYKKCPFCAESVRKEAVKCKHCQSELPAA